MVKTALVFPGQGSQSIGMLADFELEYPILRETFEEASSIIGYDIWKLIQKDPESQLNFTEYTQVAMLTADVAVYKILQQFSQIKVDSMAGHSLGEYAALVCSGALDFADGIRLVSKRGQIMQNAVPLGKGAMAAIIGLSDEQIETLCLSASTEEEVVSAANFNSIGQTVVAGHTSAVQRLIQLAEDNGAALAKILPVSVPCHCSLLEEAAIEYAKSLDQVTFHEPAVKVISNVDAQYYQSPTDICEKLKKQLYLPVRWVESIQNIKAADINLVLECGPGKVLGGLIKRIDRSLKVISVFDTISLENALEQFQ